MAKNKQLTEMSESDLLAYRDDVTEELFNLRFQNATGQLTNVRRLPEVRKERARVLTELRRREIEKYEEGLADAEEVAS